MISVTNPQYGFSPAAWMASVQIVDEFKIYGRNKILNKIIRWYVPHRWREAVWHWVALARAKNGWLERHTRGELEHTWMETRRD